MTNAPQLSTLFVMTQKNSYQVDLYAIFINENLVTFFLLFTGPGKQLPRINSHSGLKKDFPDEIILGKEKNVLCQSVPI